MGHVSRAVDGDLHHGLTLFDATIDTNHQAGDRMAVAQTLAQLAMFFDRFERSSSSRTRPDTAR
jgi:hypothetical protein